MECLTALLPLAQSLHDRCSDLGITRSLFSNTVRPPGHAAAFINASITLKKCSKGTDEATRVSQTLSPLVFPSEE